MCVASVLCRGAAQPAVPTFDLRPRRRTNFVAIRGWYFGTLSCGADDAILA